MRILLFNTTILTNVGNWEMKEITLEKATTMVVNNQDILLSAIGHESTAQLLSNIFGINIPVNRIEVKQYEDDIAICFKLNGRLQEGSVLNLNTIEEIGYKFYRIRSV